jgi:hypothetical protein
VTHDRPTTGCTNCKTWSSPVRVEPAAPASCSPSEVPVLGGAGRAVVIASIVLAVALVHWRRVASRQAV